jgi:hypothetical protein
MRVCGRCRLAHHGLLYWFTSLSLIQEPEEKCDPKGTAET